jgi:hypothetical protein
MENLTPNSIVCKIQLKSAKRMDTFFGKVIVKNYLYTLISARCRSSMIQIVNRDNLRSMFNVVGHQKLHLGKSTKFLFARIFPTREFK